MSRESVKKFRVALKAANGDKTKMEKAFKSISDYLDGSISKKRTKPGIKKIHEWSGTVLVNSDYELVNY